MVQYRQSMGTIGAQSGHERGPSQISTQIILKLYLSYERLLGLQSAQTDDQRAIDIIIKMKLTIGKRIVSYLLG